MVKPNILGSSLSSKANMDSVVQLILECIDQLTVRYVLHTSAKNYVSMTVRAHENAHDGPTIGQFDFQIFIEPTLQFLVMFRKSFHLKKNKKIVKDQMNNLLHYLRK